jgi:hypothetical protein
MNLPIKLPILFFILISFLAGIYFCIANKTRDGFTNANASANGRCPDILVQKGKSLFLYNSKVAQVPGVNPVEFENLEDYVEFLDWQRSQGIRCPVLYLQHSYDTQGESVYKVRPSPTDLQGGLPPMIPTAPNPTLLIDATRNDMPYNENSVPAYDQTSFYQGTTTPLDKMNQDEQGLLYSPNPMDDNWGGKDYTQSLVDSGYYAGNEVNIRIA